MILARVLADPQAVLTLDHGAWESLLSIAHAERLLPALACRLEGLAVPDNVCAVLTGARLNAEAGRVRALWEIEMARRALGPLGIPIVLLKGSAFIAAGLAAGQGRLVGDLTDILTSIPFITPGKIKNGNLLVFVFDATTTVGWKITYITSFEPYFSITWMNCLVLI